MSIFKALKITDSVYWVGAIDWGLRDFHGYSTNRGTTYNAYLILADKITLIDTVKKPFFNELLSRISSVIDPEKIDYVISNHAEMDHSGSLPEIIETVRPERIFSSIMGVKALTSHFHSLIDKLTPLKDGEKLSLGNKNLTFVEARMLHWPDSMITYLAEDQVMFTNDIFGMHLASSERFDDEIDFNTLEYEASKYYANIVMPYSSMVTKFAEKLENLKLPVKYIATDHGPVWRKYIPEIIKFYKTWAIGSSSLNAVITYDTMWGSTASMAMAISEGLSNSGIKTKITPIKESHRSDIVKELFDAGAFIVGSPVLNSNIFPTVVDMLTYVKGLKPQKLVSGAFGSYGWNSAPLDQLKDVLVNDMQTDFVGQVLKANYVPKEDDLQSCYNLGLQIANKLKENS